MRKKNFIGASCNTHNYRHWHSSHDMNTVKPQQQHGKIEGRIVLLTV